MNDSQKKFNGFRPLTANYVYCPNQFFDVCLPHCSRGAVRIVAYVLRQTLGWLDEQGNPRQQEIHVSYRDLIERAGVSRGAIASALAEAVECNFLKCEQQGLKKARNQTGNTAVYSMRWDSDGNYTKHANDFVGFYAGEGNRTPVPNQFFDHVVSGESLTVIKVVGTVLRQTIGYQNQFGGRRTSSPISYSSIQRLSNIRDRKTLSQALRHAEQAGFIECTDRGHFSPDKKIRRPSIYRLHWLQPATTDEMSSKSPPEKNRSKMPTSDGSESPPTHRFKKPTSKEKTVSKDIRKQNEAAAEVEAIQRLADEGMDVPTAKRLVANRGVEVVTNQLNWLNARNPRDNRVGMLRKAIDEDWVMPPSIQSRERQRSIRKQQIAQDAKHEREDARISDVKKQRAERRTELQKHWVSATQPEREAWIREAVKAEASKTIAELIRRQKPTDESPNLQVLNVIAQQRNLPPVCAMAKTK